MPVKSPSALKTSEFDWLYVKHFLICLGLPCTEGGSSSSLSPSFSVFCHMCMLGKSVLQRQSSWVSPCDRWAQKVLYSPNCSELKEDLPSLMTFRPWLDVPGILAMSCFLLGIAIFQMKLYNKLIIINTLSKSLLRASDIILMIL